MTGSLFSGILGSDMAKSPGVGSKAPIFTLKNQDGEPVNLEQALSTGPVVLIFYPGDLTPGCTIQLCSIRDDWSQFEKNNIHVFGINPGDAASHKTFVDRHTLPFPLLVDEGRKVAKRYGAEQDLLIAKIVKRTVVGIDQNGRIVYERQGMPRNSEILKAFKA